MSVMVFNAVKQEVRKKPKCRNVTSTLRLYKVSSYVITTTTWATLKAFQRFDH